MMIIIFSISFALEDKTIYDYTSTYEEQPAVYVTKYGDCYHSISCHYLSQSMIEKGLYEAFDNGYRACSHCNGISHGTVQVEHREYYEVRVYDPCCGSGGMFVQSVKFIQAHSGNRHNIAVYGQEATSDTWKMAKMNLAIRGIDADFGPYHADTFTNDLHPTLKADFIKRSCS